MARPDRFFFGDETKAAIAFMTTFIFDQITHP